MKTFALSEFTSLLRLELWNGGHLSGLGYVSPARKTNRDAGLSGLTGMRLAGGIMLEDIRREGEGSNLIFSVYDPYTGGYIYYETSAYSEGNTCEAFQSLRTGEEREAEKQRARITSSGSLFRDKLRYGSTQYSIRGGRIPSPGSRR